MITVAIVLALCGAALCVFVLGVDLYQEWHERRKE